MFEKNFATWPATHPHNLDLPTLTVYDNFERSVAAFPEKSAIVFYETCITYREMDEQVSRLAGWLYHHAKVQKGDRIGIYSQNSPQYVIAFYAALKIGAVVVPINPMCIEEELSFIVDNSGIKVLFAGLELHHSFESKLMKQALIIIGIQYKDFLRVATGLPVPQAVSHQPSIDMLTRYVSFHQWTDVFDAGYQVDRVKVDMNDLVMLPYTSGSTGNPKGCCHSNITVQHALASIYDWFDIKSGDIILAVAPMFHVIGLQAGMNSSIAVGGTLVIMPRWDRQVAAHAIHNYRVTVWPTVPTMVNDLINMPLFEQCDISSLRVMFGGGTSMPESVAKTLYELSGVTFLEGYGLTETCCPATANPPHAPKRQCGGLPVFNTLIRIVDTDTLVDLEVGDTGEILICGPQVMQEYWNDEDSNRESFVEIDGERYFRSGDLGYQDEEGYIFIVDRIKRMINASGYKVWPTQVEAVLHRHPSIAEVCVIASQHVKRGETVKALIVKKQASDELSEEELIAWSRKHLAPYKIPRIVTFVDTLPKSASGKILWRELQDREKNATGS